MFFRGELGMAMKMNKKITTIACLIIIVVALGCVFFYKTQGEKDIPSY